MLRPVRYAWSASYVLRGDGQGGFHAPVIQPLRVGVLTDADGDGDLDAVHDRLVRGAKHGGNGGARKQYGLSGAGAGGSPHGRSAR